MHIEDFDAQRFWVHEFRHPKGFASRAPADGTRPIATIYFP
jgi:hypothetical protein